MKVESTNMCFACGKDNECGLKLDFKVENGRVLSKFVVDKKFQGWKGMTHGGIVATILDESMAWSIMSLGLQAVTAELNVKYRKPTPILKELRVIGEVVEIQGKVIKTHSKILEDNSVLAEANAVYIKV